MVSLGRKSLLSALLSASSQAQNTGYYWQGNTATVYDEQSNDLLQSTVSKYAFSVNDKVLTTEFTGTISLSNGEKFSTQNASNLSNCVESSSAESGTDSNSSRYLCPTITYFKDEN